MRFLNIITALLATCAMALGQSTSGWQIVAAENGTGLITTNGDSFAPVMDGATFTNSVNVDGDVKVFFGDSDKASIYWSNTTTNLALRPREVGSGNLYLVPPAFFGVGTATPYAEIDIGGEFDPNAIPGGFDTKMAVSANVDAPMVFHQRNISAGTLADNRWVLSDTTDNYLGFFMPGTGNAGSPILGRPRNQSCYILNTGGTARNIGIGTGGSMDIVFGTANTERMFVDGTGYVAIPQDSLGLRLGAGEDVAFYFDGGDTYIQDRGITANNSLYLASFLTIQMGSTTRFNDNVKISMGTSSDFQIFHDGSDAVISNAVASDLKLKGFTEYEIDNQLRVTTNWGWEDLRFPATASARQTAASDVTLNVTNNSVTFDSGAGGASTNLTDDHIYGIAQWPHTWRTGSVVKAHVHFEQAFSDEDSCFYLRYRNHPLGGAMATTWTFIGPATNHFTYTSGTIHQMAIFPDIDMTGMEESSITDWKLYMLGTAVSNDVEVKEFDIHYQIERVTGEQF